MKTLILIIGVVLTTLFASSCSNGRIVRRTVDITYINAIDSTSVLLEDPNNPGIFFPEYIPVKLEVKHVRTVFNNTKITYKVIK